MTPPNAVEDVEQQELSFISGGNQNGTATLEDGLMFFFFLNKTKHTKNKNKIWTYSSLMIQPLHSLAFT